MTEKDKEKLEEEQDSQEQDLQEQPSPIEIIEGLRQERDEYYDLLLRKQAEFENFRKRVLKEKEEERKAGHAELLKELLHVVDACEKGLKSMEEQAAEQGLDAYREGYELLLKRLHSILQKFGVEQVPSAGAQFDPNIHEAVSTEPSEEHEEGQILEEVRKGYKMKDRLLRPAQVKVAVKK